MSAPARRAAWLPVAGVAVSAAVVLLSSTRPRVAQQEPAVDLATTPAATSLALVALAAATVLYLLDVTARRVVATLLVVVGIAIVVAMMSSTDDYRWFAYGGSPWHDRRSAWSWTGAVAGVFLVVFAVWTLVRVPCWPRPRRTGAGGGDGHGPTEAAARADSPWDRLDRGDDPTA